MDEMPVIGGRQQVLPTLNHYLWELNRLGSFAIVSLDSAFTGG